jgi:hypothetical protein
LAGPDPAAGSKGLDCAIASFDVEAIARGAGISGRRGLSAFVLGIGFTISLASAMLDAIVGGAGAKLRIVATDAITLNVR